MGRQCWLHASCGGRLGRLVGVSEGMQKVVTRDLPCVLSLCITLSTLALTFSIIPAMVAVLCVVWSRSM